MTNSTAIKTTTRRSILYGTLAALACVFVGGILMAIEGGDSRVGITMFLILPAVTGFVTVLFARYWLAVLVSLNISLALCLSGLVFTGLEGIVCVAMAFPIVMLGALLGACLGMIVKQFTRTESSLAMAVLPFAAGLSVLGAGKVEDSVNSGVRTEVIATTIVIDATPDDVWDALIEFDQVDGPQPLLMKLGLPIPESCDTVGSGVESERTCHFNSGFIRERITAWQPPTHLKFDVEEVSLPGRHWLGFKGAEYRLEQIDATTTRVTRTTMLTSTLRPAIYWRYFERLGTETEHNYILKSLQTNFASRE